METTNIKELSKKIRRRCKKVYGFEGYVLYLPTDNKVDIGDYKNLKIYAAQAGETSVEVSFNLSTREMVKFSTKVDSKSTNKESYEKYGGIIYTYEPLTEEIAHLINNII